MRRFVLALFLSFLAQTTLADGLQRVESPHDVDTTIDRLQAALESKGLRIFDRIDHAANADGAGLDLAPSQLLIFGNPALGTPLMNCAPTVALDLPQKMLAWQDSEGQTHLAWNDPLWLKSRHAIEGCDEVLDRISGALQNFAAAATGE